METSLEVPFLAEMGYQRKRCVKCRRFFWTLNQDQEVCGDQPCAEYSFLGNPPTSSRPSLSEVRESFLSFFEKRGHRRIRRYPIVARWRDDVYLVGASIYDFQPWVTSGILPPPANPLAVSQPSIRLTDVDNVGRTGRHLTSFEMMAHHAFNQPGKEIYWIDQTARYCYEYYTEAWQIQPELISFVEDIWRGGGNAGEDLEVIIRNAEVATLVFMHYLGEQEDSWQPLPNRTVDTGYGLERITWLLNGSPTIFDVTYPGMLDFIKSKASLSRLEQEVFIETAKIGGILNLQDERSYKHYQEELSRRTGISWSELEKPLAEFESAYAIADHTRSLAWMLGDFVVPSNVGAGYLARLLLRRILRHMHRIQLELPLTEVMKVQIEQLRGDFPEVAENLPTLMEILENEERKYRDSMRRGTEIVERELKAEGKSKGLSVEKLIELYDSQGLAPEIVREVAEKRKVRVDVPLNFYSLVAQRHEKAKRPEKTDEKEVLVKSLDGLPETKPLYYDEPYRTEFEAQILKVIDGKYAVLDQTAFYPEGGGQPGDVGQLLIEESKVRVKDTVKLDGIILHELQDGVKLAEGGWIHGEIDAKRRILLMRSHTATHILNGSSRAILGPHIWQTGAQKGEQISRLDVTHFKKMTREEVRKIETLANETVMRNLPLSTNFMNREEAEAKHGYRLYQGGYVPGRKVRVVEIPSFDVEACGGTHLEHTGEVGVIKILRTERIQDGVERLEFTVGLPAVEYFEQIESDLQEAGRMLETPTSNVPIVLQKTLDDLRAKQKMLESLKLQVIESLTPKLLAKSEPQDSVQLLLERLDGYSTDDLIQIAARLTVSEANLVAVLYSMNEKITLVVSAGKKAITKGKDAGKIARELSQLVGGGGGGKPEMGQGGGKDRAKVSEWHDYLLKHL